MTVADADPRLPLAACRLFEPVREQAMFLLDPGGRVASWNEGVGLILGWRREDWIGQPLQVIYTPDDVQAGVPQAELRQAADRGRADTSRWLRRRDGERFFAQASTTQIVDDAGRPLGFLKLLRECDAVPAGPGGMPDASGRGATHDASDDLRRVQTVLDERDAKLRALVDRVRDYAIFTLNTEGRISSWHAGAALMKGYPAEEAIGMPYAELFSADERAAGRPAHELQIAAATGEYKGEGRRLRKDGSSFEAAVVLTALRGPRGDLLGYLKLTQDITERKRMERERDAMLREAQEAHRQAERASRAKDEFLATVSHELRTPLSAILGWAHVLERGVFDAETVRHGLAAISRNARSQGQLIEDLLDMNRIESGQLRLDLQRIELGGVIAAAIDSALPAATAKGVGLRTVFGPGLASVMGDATRLQQVVANLLNNAIKFTPGGGQVSVSLTQLDGQVQIVVADTGQGIEPDFLSRLFDRFQQQDTTTTRRHGGLGIGLSIVRHLVQLHGGKVQAHSAGHGQGATFTVTLPALGGPVLAQPSPAAQHPDRPADAAARLDGVTVLAVDDEPDVLAVTVQVLQQVGARVLSAATADEALALLRRHHPEVLLSDIAMPDTDGYELIRRVRRLPAAEGGQTPAAAVTAYARPDDRQRALLAGFQLHLAKPLPPTALVAAVAALAQGRTPAGA